MNIYRYYKSVREILQIKSNEIINLISSALIISILDIAMISLAIFYFKLVFTNSNELSIYNYKILVEDKKNFVIYYGIFLVGVFTIKFVLNLYLNNKIIVTSQNYLMKLRIKLIKSIIEKSNNKYNYANDINLVTNISEKFIHDVLLISLKFITDLIILIIILCLAFTLDPYSISILIIFIFTIGLIYDQIIKEKLIHYGKKTNESKREIFLYADNLIKSNIELTFLNKIDFFLNKFLKYSENYGTSYSKTQLLSTAPKYLIEFLITNLLFITVLITFVINADENNRIVKLGVLIFIIFRILPLLYSVVQSIAYLRSSSHSFYAIKQALINKCRNLVVDTNAFDSIDLINLKKILFKYNDKEVFNDLNLEIQRGKFYAIISDSGSGKSTLLKILMGLNKPHSGNYFINNINVDYDNILRVMQKFISYIPQSPFIFEGTLLENITLTDDKNIPLNKLLEILDAIDLDLNIDNILDYQLTHDGTNISGGQRQKIIIARALYQNKDILLLDEPVSSLDYLNRNIIYNLLMKINKDYKKTIICVSHDLEIKKYADIILNIG